MPDFIALSTDPQTEAAAKTIGRVLWDDLNFEREFYMIPRDTYQTIPAAHSFADVPFDAWRELGTDAVVVGTVERTDGGNLRVQVRLLNVKSHQSVFAKEYTGSATNPRFYAHTISDEIFLQQRGLHGVARTKLAFASDRDEERMPGTVLDRTVKEIYISDYDGANQRRVTVNRSLNIVPAWSPDAQSIAYTSYRRGIPQIFISFIYKGTLKEVTKGSQNFLPAWSPDGKHLAFMSDRDGHDNIYVMDADGSNVRQVTHGPSINASPTWSPSGTEIAFTSDRSGLAADLRRRGRRPRPAADHARMVLRPADLVAGAVQRDRLRLTDRARVRHQDSRSGNGPDPPGHVRRRLEPESLVRAERPSPGVHVDPHGAHRNLHGRARRQGPAPDHDQGQQLPAELVTLTQ